MSTPRIDTLHRVIDSVIVRLDELWPDVEDLHDLAHVRHKAAAAAKVSGGDPTAVGIDLDTHGDPEARRHLAAISNDLIELGREAEKHLKLILAGGDNGGIEAVWWDGAQFIERCPAGASLDLLVTCGLNAWQGTVKPQLTIKDARLSDQHRSR